MKPWKWVAIAMSCAVILTACGGSDGANTTPKTVPAAVKVFGDSLMDSGTFGHKFTIQSSDPARPFLLFPEIVAGNFGVNQLCPFFTFNGITFASNPSCTNYAVAGARVNNLTNPSTPGSNFPLSIPFQLVASSASLSTNDIVIVNGGSNDLADVITAYLGATTPAGVNAYTTALGTVLPSATVSSIIGVNPTPTSLAAAAGVYAQAVGQTLAASIKANVVAKGVAKIVVVNSTDITATPRFQAILAAVAAASGSAQRDALQAAARAWTQALNNALTQGLAGTTVQVFDLYEQGPLITNNPAQFALTNITTPACPKVAGGTNSFGLPSLSLAPTVATCTSANLSTNIPIGETSPNWWMSYAFADEFHPSPALHKLIAQSINLQLGKAGWL